MRAPSVKIDSKDDVLPTTANAVDAQEDLDHGPRVCLQTAGDVSAFTLQILI